MHDELWGLYLYVISFNFKMRQQSLSTVFLWVMTMRSKLRKVKLRVTEPQHA